MQDWIDARSRDADTRALLALLSRVATYCGDLDALDAPPASRRWCRRQSTASCTSTAAGSSWSTRCNGVARRTRRHAPARAKVDAIERRDDRVRRAHRARRPATPTPWCTRPADQPTLDAMLHGASATVHGWAERERPVYASTLDLALRTLPVPDRRIMFGLDEPRLLLGAHAVRAAGDGGSRRGRAPALVRRPRSTILGPARGAARPGPAGMARPGGRPALRPPAGGRPRPAAPGSRLRAGDRRWRCPTCPGCSWPATGWGPRACSPTRCSPAGGPRAARRRTPRRQRSG